MPEAGARMNLSGPALAAFVGLLLIALASRAWFLSGPQIDYDEGVYWQSLRAMAAGHPLFTSVYSSQPPGFLLLIAPIYDILGQTLPAARAGVTALSLVGILAAYDAVSGLAGHAVGLAAAAMLVVDPIYLRQSVTLQADGPAIALALAALAAAVRSASAEGRAGLLLAAAAGALLSLACMVKLLALPAAAPLLLLLWPSGRRLGALLAGGIVTAAALLAPFAGDLPLVLQQSVGLHLAAGVGQLGGLGGLAGTATWEMPLAVLALASAAFGRRARLFTVGLTWLLLSVAALFVIHPVWPHHLVVLAVPLALVAAPLPAALASRTRRLVPAVALVVLGAGASAAIVQEQGIPAERAYVARIAHLVGPDQAVITDDQFGAALADRSTPPELVDTSLVRIHTGNLTAAEVERIAKRDHVPVIVFATGRLAGLPGFAAWAATAYPTQETIAAATFSEQGLEAKP